MRIPLDARAAYHTSTTRLTILYPSPASHVLRSGTLARIVYSCVETILYGGVGYAGVLRLFHHEGVDAGGPGASAGGGRGNRKFRQRVEKVKTRHGSYAPWMRYTYHMSHVACKRYTCQTREEYISGVSRKRYMSQASYGRGTHHTHRGEGIHDVARIVGEVHV